MESIKVVLLDAAAKRGTRVGMFASFEEVNNLMVLNFYGWGRYEGDFRVGDTEGIISYQSAAEKLELYNKEGVVTDARLRHDNGTVTWGRLAWWSDEVEIQRYIEAADVVNLIPLKDRMQDFDKRQQIFMKEVDEFVDAGSKINVKTIYES